jgi:hypothetical protein
LTNHFWLPSVDWVTSYGDGIPEVDSAGQQNGQPSSPEIASARARAIQLYIESLRPDAPVMSRWIAFRMANITSIRQNTAVQEALRKLLETEKNDAARNALRGSDPQEWIADLQEAVRKEPLAAALKDSQGQPQLTPQFISNFRYFSDYVAPELSRPQRMDEMSCMRCHATPGRVPSMELAGPDGNGYWSMAKMLKNYLILQQRVNVADIETSKLLRKPLNVQTGKEDGHQGGRRYLPAERGYQIIRRWVLDQPRVAQSLGTPLNRT